jgi:MYXO-CTERM domain-containing protein
MHQLDGLPLYAVPLLRAAFTAEGIDPASVTDAGDIDAGLLAVSLMDTVTIRTNVTPDVTFNVKDTVTGEASPATKLLQPTLILDGGAVRHRVIAPHGESSGGGIVFAGLVGLGAAALIRFFRKR